jgi:phosphopantothenoylcysteine decarboxylase/phosphopantothenate--cysteine ligase
MIAPAMNQGMWQHVLTQQNCQSLQQKGVLILGTTEGSQACGDVGPGRMLEPTEIREKLSALFATHAMARLNVLITAGPTHEAIDPVRFITNGSSGKMGFALAEAAKEAGANVTLISGPVSLAKPPHIETLSILNAQEMYDAVMSKVEQCDIFLAVAAVGDYRCQTVAKQKIHKTKDTLQLVLERNPDIVGSVGQLPNRPFIVGFAAETENLLNAAKEKRQRKKMDMIIANQVGLDIGMGSDENAVIVIGSQGETTIPPTEKHKLARELIAMIADEFKRDKRDKKKE